MAGTKTAEKHLASDASKDDEVRDANATGAGRKALCKADMGNGDTCGLWKNHDGEHNTLAFDLSELDDEEMTPEEIAAISVAERSADQVAIDEKVAANYAAWVKAGSDKSHPLWKKFPPVPAPKAEKLRRMLRAASDYHNPPVQVRVDEALVGSNIRIAYAALTRRAYNKDGDKK
jgi:hypothetical protein